MKQYKYHPKDGLVDETGKQLLVLLPSNCSRKFCATAGKLLANTLNNIERGNALRSKPYFNPNEGFGPI